MTTVKLPRNSPVNLTVPAPEPSSPGTSGEGQDLGFSGRLRTVLATLGPQREVAKAIGVSWSRLKNWLSGAAEPGLANLRAVADLTGVSLDWLVYGIEPQERRESGLAQPSEPAPPLMTAGSLPVLGLAECGLEGWFQERPWAMHLLCPPDIADPAAFAVIAVGESLIPAGIHPGFACICSPGIPPVKGDVVFIERSDGGAANPTGALKLFVRADRDWVTLRGWLPPDEAGRQQPYEDRLARRVIRRLAPVVWIKRKL